MVSDTLEIAIITFYDADNMGAMLQAIALKRYLQNYGYLVKHIRIRSDAEIKKSFEENCPNLDINILRYFARFLKHPVDNLRLYPLFVSSCRKKKWIYRRKKIFKKYLKDMAAVKITEDASDIYILGSDEIWNITAPVCRKPIFWGEGYGPSIVYAASLSGASENVYESYPDIIKKFSNFKAITVRDDNSRSIIQALTGKKIDKVVDPTILLENDPIVRGNSGNNKKPFLLLYGYPYQWKSSIPYIKRFAKEENISIVSLWFYLEFADQNVVCQPEEFITYFNEAKYVITTTFHGSIFSILSRAQFITYSPRDKGRQLLEEFNQDKRIIEKTATYDMFANVLRTPCIYEETFKIIQSKRKQSAEILNKMIGKFAKRE